jgi:hypothetical protein
MLRSSVFVFALLNAFLLNSAWAEFVEPTFAQERAPELPAQSKLGPLTPIPWSECQPMKDTSGEPDLGFAKASFECPKAFVLMGQGRKLSGVKRQANALVLAVDGQAALRLKFNDRWLAPFLDTVHSADLNGDGRADFVLELSFHGNGLAAVRTQLLFLVSDTKGYRFSHFSDITSPALAQFGRAEPSQALAAETVFSIGRFASELRAKPVEKASGKASLKIKTSDGKPHVFFVFDLLGFKTHDAFPYLFKHAGFPRWVLFQNTVGATETALISAEDKARLWSSPLEGLRSGYLTQ